MIRPFIIYALPRSRTFWLSKFLSYREWYCGHDELRHARSLDDVRSWLSQACTGTVETAGAPYWRLAQQMCPDMRTVVVRRPVAAVVASLMALGLPFDRDRLMCQMRMLDAKLDQIEARAPKVLSVRFADLDRDCGRVFEHCLPYASDAAWNDALCGMNLQCNVLASLRYNFSYEPQLMKLAKIAKHKMLAAMARKIAPEIDGLTIQQEPFDLFYQDSASLFASHLVGMAEAPDDFARKNVALMRKLDAAGLLQVTTARSNGRMFGYLMAVLGPSLEAPERMSASHVPFYASPDFPGLGMKLQRASTAALRAKGVSEVFMLAGKRGEGPSAKMGAFYKRLGATELATMFKLELDAA